MSRHGTALLSLRRNVHLIDIENLCGTAHLTVEDVQYAAFQYHRSVHVMPEDNVIIGSSHHNLLATGLGWTNVRHVVQSGVDGADRALQAVMANEGLDRRYERAILATGDGGFDFSIAALTRLGCDVSVVAPAGRTARRLLLAASRVILADFSRKPADDRMPVKSDGLDREAIERDRA